MKAGLGGQVAEVVQKRQKKEGGRADPSVVGECWDGGREVEGDRI